MPTDRNLRYCYRLQAWIVDGVTDFCSHGTRSCLCPAGGQPHPSDCPDCH